MLKIIFIISIIMVIGISTNYAHSQEIGLSTFQESAQVIIDKKNIQYEYNINYITQFQSPRN